MSSRYRLDLVRLMRKGIEHTGFVKGAMTARGMTDACAMGAVKAALYGFTPKGTCPRWERVKEYLLRFRLDVDRLPEAYFDASNWKRAPLPVQGTVSLHKALSVLNDHRIMSREAIAEWLDAELTEEERTVLFGRARSEAGGDTDDRQNDLDITFPSETAPAS